MDMASVAVRAVTVLAAFVYVEEITKSGKHVR